MVATLHLPVLRAFAFRLALPVLGILAAAAPRPVLAEDETSCPWTYSTHFVMTGASDENDSEPVGYKLYSSFSLDGAIQRRLGRRLSVELAFRTDSREVDLFSGPGEALRLGSVEVLPVDLLLQYRLRTEGALRPYLGAGLNLTICWEKSGALDSTDLTPSLTPAVQVGMDVPVAPSLLLNLDVKWHPWRPELEAEGKRVARQVADTLSLGVGVGFRF